MGVGGPTVHGGTGIEPDDASPVVGALATAAFPRDRHPRDRRAEEEEAARQQAWTLLTRCHAPSCHAPRVKVVWNRPASCLQYWETGVVGLPRRSSRTTCSRTPEPISQELRVNFPVFYDDGTSHLETFRYEEWLRAWDVEGSRYFHHEGWLGSYFLHRREETITVNRVPLFELREERRLLAEARSMAARQEHADKAQQAKERAQLAKAKEDAKRQLVAEREKQQRRETAYHRATAAAARTAARLRHEAALFHPGLGLEPDAACRVEPRAPEPASASRQEPSALVGTSSRQGFSLISHLLVIDVMTSKLLTGLSCHAYMQVRCTSRMALTAVRNFERDLSPSQASMMRLKGFKELSLVAPGWLSLLLDIDLLQMPSLASYVDYIPHAPDRVSARLDTIAEQLHMLDALQAGRWSEVRYHLMGEHRPWLHSDVDPMEEETFWLTIVSKLEGARLCQTFPFHLTQSPDAAMEENREMRWRHHHYTKWREETHVAPRELHPEQLSVVPMPKPSCRGYFLMGSSAGVQGKESCKTAVRTKPSARAQQCAARASGARASAVESFIKHKTRWSILLSFYEAAYRSGIQSGLVYLAGAAAGAHACLSGCGYSGPDDVYYLGAARPQDKLPRNSVANGHDIWWVNAGPRRRCYANRSDLMGITDLCNFSMTATVTHPHGLNLKDFSSTEQALLYELCALSNHTLAKLVDGSRTIVVEDVGSAHAAAAASLQHGLIERCSTDTLYANGRLTDTLRSFRDLVGNETPLWKSIMRPTQWVVVGTGRTVGPYRNPVTKRISSGNQGRLHSLLLMSINSLGVAILKGFSLEGTAKPPHGKLVEIPSDMVSRSLPCNGKWSPLSAQERVVASDAFRVRLAKGWILITEGSNGVEERIAGSTSTLALAGGWHVVRPGVEARRGASVMPQFLEAFRQVASREIETAGGVVDIWPHGVAVLSDSACDYVALSQARLLFRSLPCVQGIHLNVPAIRNGLLPRLAGCLDPLMLLSTAEWHCNRWSNFTPAGCDLPTSHRLPPRDQLVSAYGRWQAQKSNCRAARTLSAFNSAPPESLEVPPMPLEDPPMSKSSGLSKTVAAALPLDVEQTDCSGAEFPDEASDADEEALEETAASDLLWKDMAIREVEHELGTHTQAGTLVEMLKNHQNPGKESPSGATFSVDAVTDLLLSGPAVKDIYPGLHELLQSMPAAARGHIVRTVIVDRLKSLTSPSEPVECTSICTPTSLSSLSRKHSGRPHTRLSQGDGRKDMGQDDRTARRKVNFMSLEE